MDVVGNQVGFVLELKVNSDRMVKGISPLIVDAIAIASELGVVVTFTYEGYDLQVGPSDNHEDAIAAYRAMRSAETDADKSRDEYAKEKERHVRSVLKNHPVGRYVPEEQLEFGGSRPAYYSFSVDNGNVKTEGSGFIPPLGILGTSESLKHSYASLHPVPGYRAIPTAFGLAVVDASKQVGVPATSFTYAKPEDILAVNRPSSFAHANAASFSSVMPGSGLNVNADSHLQLGVNLLPSPSMFSKHINRTGEIKAGDLNSYATPSEIRNWLCANVDTAGKTMSDDIKAPQPPTKEVEIMPEKKTSPEPAGQKYVAIMTDDEILCIVKDAKAGKQIEQCAIGSSIDSDDSQWFDTDFQKPTRSSWSFNSYRYRVKRRELSGFINIYPGMLHATPELADEASVSDRLARIFVRFKEGDLHTTHMDADQ